MPHERRFSFAVSVVADLDSVSLRFFTVYGPRQRPDMAFNKFIGAMLEEREIVIYGDGAQTRDFTYIDDIVEGLRLAPNAPPGSVMNLGGGNRVSLAEAIETLGRVVGAPPRLVHRPVEAGDVRDAAAGMCLAGRILGLTPACDLATGLTAQAAWLRKSVPMSRSHM